jgi:hypothetical protein
MAFQLVDAHYFNWDKAIDCPMKLFLDFEMHRLNSDPAFTNKCDRHALPLALPPTLTLVRDSGTQRRPLCPWALRRGAEWMRLPMLSVCKPHPCSHRVWCGTQAERAPFENHYVALCRERGLEPNANMAPKVPRSSLGLWLGQRAPVSHPVSPLLGG